MLALPSMVAMLIDISSGTRACNTRARAAAPLCADGAKAADRICADCKGEGNNEVELRSEILYVKNLAPHCNGQAYTHQADA